jgi:hypothetical protein
VAVSLTHGPEPGAAAPPLRRLHPNELGVVRDLNNAWYARCLEWLKMGLEILDDAYITADHKASRDAVLDYLKTHDTEPTLF